jgi:diguanylate cyclase (GGDEF)-like protein
MRLPAKLATAAILIVAAGRLASGSTSARMASGFTSLVLPLADCPPGAGEMPLPMPNLGRPCLNPSVGAEPQLAQPLARGSENMAGQCLAPLSGESASRAVKLHLTEALSRPPGGFYFALAFVVVLGPILWQWHGMTARERQLKRLVMERTRELEEEKSQLLQTKAALVKLASLDSLTGLYNRAAILEVLDYELERSRQEGSEFAVIFADMDGFKGINDTYGHLAGDSVLRDFGCRIKRHLRHYDRVGRYGGEELLLLMPGIKEEAESRIHELHRQVNAEPYIFGALTLRVTCSFGVCWFPAKLNTVEGLLGLADQALYLAKSNGRNRVEIAGRRSMLPVDAAELYHGT